MEPKYWRRPPSSVVARIPQSAEASHHLADLPGRYDLAKQAAAPFLRLDDKEYYRQLEAGARFMASQSLDTQEREVHLGMANHYVTLGRHVQRRGRN